MLALNELPPVSLYPISTPKKTVLNPHWLLFVNLKIALIYEQYSHQLEQMLETNAAVINISGRQRMLSQRVAFFCTQLVVAPTEIRSSLRQRLRQVLDLMETSHLGLLYGNKELKLSGHHSPEMFKLYHLPPYHLDHQVREFIQAGRVLLAAAPEQLTLDHPAFQHIVEAASYSLLNTLDKAVSQYQREKEGLDLTLDIYQAQLYQESLDAQAIAEEKAEQLQQTVKKLKTTQLQLVQSEKLSSLGYLSAGLAHEINNPLNFIYGNLVHAQQHIADLLTYIDLVNTYQHDAVIESAREELEIDYLREDLPKMIDSMLQGASRIRNLVLDLKKFSRKDPAYKETLNLHEVLESSLVILQHRLQIGKPIKVIKQYAEIPLVACHINQINQVFLNLLSNAIDAVQDIDRAAEITVITQAIAHEQHPHIVRITIADNGQGMSPEVKKHLFEPFYTTKERGQGTGLGLSICRQIIVEGHQGNLQCESQENIGTKFIVDLPINGVHTID